MGTEMYDLAAVIRSRMPCITYDDGTLQQMWEHHDSDIRNGGFPADHVRKWIMRQAESSRAASLCCVSTRWAARSFIEDYGIPQTRVAIVGMGHRPRTASLSDKDWSIPTYLFVGVDWQRKNGAMVLDAFSRLRSHIPEAVLHVVGNHPVIEQPGVHEHGFLPRNDAAAQQRLDHLYASATCFVLPSKFDPSPISYFEAASAGLPVIATSQGGAGELLGQGALTVDPRNAGQIAEAMLRLADATTARTMGAAATAAAVHSSWQGVASRILEALQESVRGVALSEQRDDHHAI
jgi:glycosyltransferase involved in cell wall biosynthesis